MYHSVIDFQVGFFGVLSQVSHFQLCPVPYGSKEGELPFVYSNNGFRQLCNAFSDSCRQCQQRLPCCSSNFNGFVDRLVSVPVCRQIKGGKIAYCPFLLLSSWQHISHSVPWLMLATFNWPLTEYRNRNIQLQLSSSALHLCLITLSCLLCPSGLKVEDLLHTNAQDSWLLKLCLPSPASRKGEWHCALSRRLSRNSCIRKSRKKSRFLKAV